MPVNNLLLIALGYLSGSLMFSVWLTRLRGRDVRTVGDGNPGAVNAYKAAGPVIGTAALLLDFLKGALPVAVAVRLAGIDGWWLVPILLAPVLGHVFPVFESFRGGKAIDVTFGVWAGVTVWEVPTVMGAAMAFGMLVIRFKEDALSALLGMIVLVTFVALRYQDLPLSVASILCAATVVLRHRRELMRR
jgi:glycerol-3-phosphate acyltransferase PlsY